jgi:3-hydroxyisobutyrate dehydrogenase
MTKDLGLAVEAAKTSDSALGLGAYAHQLYSIMSSSGYGDKDFSAVYEYLSKAPKESNK